ncbi:MAG TPA: RcnB family protein [Acidobacteriaceae bacterium]|jgi:Ni/Co efflux regulator RcnB|nr:RcnB family protein [Acidobacteriaceae bacterium]
MNRICRVFAVSTLALTLTGAVAFAQDHHDDQDHHQQYVKHQEWHKGAKIRNEDWSRGEQVSDWHAHHLRRPPAGYEWRQVDGNYVMANSDGVIFSVVIGH